MVVNKISDAISKHIFKKGFSYGKENGHGLGLFHAKSCVESWKGRLLIKSLQQTGCVIEIWLPFIT
jgi:sensor histidine kinase regulating citrate/malate metabolism